MKLNYQRKQLNRSITRTYNLAFRIVRRNAAEIVKHCPDIQSFTMAMGGWFFVHANGENIINGDECIGSDDNDGHLYCLPATQQAIKQFTDFIHEFADCKIPGNPFRIRKAANDKVTVDTEF